MHYSLSTVHWLVDLVLIRFLRHIERCLEDHELVEEVVQFWHGNKAVRLIVRDVPTKYKLWEKPQVEIQFSHRS